uniref:tetratricopeptide repeat protein n=1 Tax=Candidatus Electronema sp. TaxID=2698783 RepID=UPI00405686E0
MDGNVIDVVCDKLQWLLDHPEVTWSGSGIYALSLTGSAVFAVAVYVRRRKKKSPPSSEEHLRPPLPAQNITNQFNSGGGEQTNLQGDHGIAKQVNNHGPVISTSGNQSPAIHGPNATVNYNNMPPNWTQYTEEFGVTKAALTSFFKILQEPQVPPGDLDSKLREFACQHKELKLRLQVISSDDPEVKVLKKQAEQAFDNGRFSEVEELLNQAKERDRAAVATLKASVAEQQAALEKRQLSEAQSCVEQADLQRLQYRYEKSAQYYQEAAAALPEGRKAERADYLGAAGQDLKQIARYEEALRLYEQSLSISRAIGDKEGVARLLQLISHIYHVQGDYKKALEHLGQSLSIFRKLSHKEGEGATLNSIAAIHLDKGDYPNALKYLEQSLLLAREIKVKKGEATILNNIGQIHLKQKNYATALQCYEQALAIGREIKDKLIESGCLNSIGQVYHDQENYDAALEQYEQSLAIIQRIGDRRNEGAALNNIGKSYEAKGDYAAALKQYEQSLAIAKEIGDKDGEAVTSWNIGVLYEKQVNLAEAKQYMNRAVELGTQLEHPDLELWRKALEEVRAKLRGQQE